MEKIILKVKTDQGWINQALSMGIINYLNAILCCSKGFTGIKITEENFNFFLDKIKNGQPILDEELNLINEEAEYYIIYDQNQLFLVDRKENKLYNLLSDEEITIDLKNYDINNNRSKIYTPIEKEQILEFYQKEKSKNKINDKKIKINKIY